MKWLLLILGFTVGFAASYFLSAPAEGDIKIDRYIDTVIVRDTIRYRELVPVKKYITRVDTAYLQVANDTIRVLVDMPIEHIEHKEADFRAVIEGYRPKLVSMEVYPTTKYITNTEVRTITKHPKFGIGMQVGYGIAGNKATPYVGIGIHYNLFSF